MCSSDLTTNPVAAFQVYNGLYALSSGNVGIGITTPSTTLHVNGATLIQGPTVSTTTTNVVGNFGLRISQLTSQQSTVGQIVGQMCFHGSGRPYASSFIRSITDSSNGWDDASALVFGVSSGGTGAAEAMRISSTSNVGIGTSTPGYLFDVNGTSRLTTGAVISGANVINFGYDVAGKEVNAGKIGYQAFTAGFLDIVGAGATTRAVKIWDKIGRAHV